METFPRSTSPVSGLSASTTHIDSDTLTAFIESALSDDESAPLFEHLAECPACRECLAASGELKEFVWNNLEQQHQRQKSSRRARPLPLFVAAAGIACAIATVSLCFCLRHHPQEEVVVARSGFSAGDASFASLKSQRMKVLWGGMTLLGRRDEKESRTDRFFKDVALAAAPLGAINTINRTRELRGGIPGIAVRTPLGERKIMLYSFGESSRDLFGLGPPDAQQETAYNRGNRER